MEVGLGLAPERSVQDDTTPISRSRHNSSRQTDPCSPPHTWLQQPTSLLLTLHVLMSYVLPLPLIQLISQCLSKNKRQPSTNSFIVPIPVLGQSLIKTTCPTSISTGFSCQHFVGFSYISNAKAPPNTADKKITFLRNMELPEY